MKKIIVLDRDGVINVDSSAYIKSPAEWYPIPGSLEAIAGLNRAGWQVVVATNQSGIGRGYYDESMLARIHEKMQQAVAAVGGHIDAIFYCPHHPDQGCLCRKPLPGMLHQIASRYEIADWSDTCFVGDSLTDVQAAVAMGCQPVLVMTGNGATVRANYPELAHVPCFADLATAAVWVKKKAGAEK